MELAREGDELEEIEDRAGGGEEGVEGENREGTDREQQPACRFVLLVYRSSHDVAKDVRFV